MSRGIFDEFADRTSSMVGRAPFFVFSLLLILVWIPTLFFLNLNLSQLLINTATTILTFLMVSLLENSTQRFEKSTNSKLNAIADALADFMTSQDVDPSHVKDLKNAVDLEKEVEA